MAHELLRRPVEGKSLDIWSPFESMLLKKRRTKDSGLPWKRSCEGAHPFTHLHLLDTSIASDNIGDEIIMEAVRRETRRLAPHAYWTTSSTHDGLGPFGRGQVERADWVILGGTNGLYSRFQGEGMVSWTLRGEELSLLKGKLVLWGVGAQGRGESLDPRQGNLLGSLLADAVPHGVRDRSAQLLLEKLGKNSTWVGCPTLWTQAGREIGSPERPGTVCLALTAHRPNRLKDRELLGQLRRVYHRFCFWPQQPRDLDYFRALMGPEEAKAVEVLPPNLEALDEFLRTTDADYVGTRVHGGIRAIAHGRWSVLLGIDHRAEEVGGSVGIPVLPREAVGELGNLLARHEPYRIELPAEALQRFREFWQTRWATNA